MEKYMRKPIVICGLGTLSCLLWGSAFPSVKLGYEWLQISSSSSKLLFAGYRFLLAGILTILFASLLDRRFAGLKKGAVIPVALLGILQTGIQYFFFYIGLSNTTGVKGAITNAVNAFSAILLAHFFIKGEQLNKRKVIGCILGLTGVVAANYTAGSLAGGITLRGEGYLMIASTCYGAASVYIKKISDRAGSMAMTGWNLIIGGTMLLIGGLVMGGKVTGFDLRSSLLLLYLAFLSAAAFSLWTLLLKYNEVGKVAVYMFLTPIFGVVLSGLVLKEKAFTIKNMLALVFVCVGIYIVNRKKEQL